MYDMANISNNMSLFEYWLIILITNVMFEKDRSLIYPSFFDIVLEYTCYCAIDPIRRTDYVNIVDRILKHNGKFIVSQRNIYSLSNFTSIRWFIKSCIHLFFREEFKDKPSEQKWFKDKLKNVILYNKRV